MFYIVFILLIFVKCKYEVIYNFIKMYVIEVFDMVVVSGIECNDVIVNFVFFFSFNVYGGFNIFFLEFIDFISVVGKDFMYEFYEEVKVVVVVIEGKVMLKVIENMLLLKFVVYEGFCF